MMTYDQKLLFTTIAFLAVVLKDGDSLTAGSVVKVHKLAEVLESFCVENVPQPFVASSLGLAEENGAEKIDALIERYKKDLTQKQETILPEDKETLLQFYDRLQLRKSRRMQQKFYARATEAKLADLVLKLLDEEIEDLRAGDFH